MEPTTAETDIGPHRRYTLNTLMRLTPSNGATSAAVPSGAALSSRGEGGRQNRECTPEEPPVGPYIRPCSGPPYCNTSENNSSKTNAVGSLGKHNGLRPDTRHMSHGWRDPPRAPKRNRPQRTLTSNPIGDASWMHSWV